MQQTWQDSISQKLENLHEAFVLILLRSPYDQNHSKHFARHTVKACMSQALQASLGFCLPPEASCGRQAVGFAGKTPSGTTALGGNCAGQGPHLEQVPMVAAAVGRCQEDGNLRNRLDDLEAMVDGFDGKAQGGSPQNRMEGKGGRRDA